MYPEMPANYSRDAMVRLPAWLSTMSADSASGAISAVTPSIDSPDPKVVVDTEATISPADLGERLGVG
ncbi:hypothetical protein [Pseudonocardia yunnanensis]|uniref:Uncharacterized protein n=1 Tax=Pseudonocardia yunnanensis TaxID=58107 RepID=A0ABW4EV17_9PSEU